MDLDHGGFVGLLLFGLLAAGANLVGGFVLIRSGAHRFGERFLKYLVALGAGFMLAAIFIEIVPESVSIWTAGRQGKGSAEAVVGAMTLLLGGYLLIQLFEHTIAPHFHFGAETHPESFMRPSAAYAIMLASGRSARKALWATAAIGAATLAGVIAVALLSSRITGAVAYALPFSAGVTLYVAASDLIPEVNHKEERNPTVSIVVFVGVALFYLLHRLIEG